MIRLVPALLASLLAPALAMASDGSGGHDGLWSGFSSWVRLQQQGWHEELATAVRALRDEHGAEAAMALATASFLYGVFHALGPGHGKAVIMTYAATSESRMRRAIWMSAGSAVVQALSAIAIVSVAFLLVTGGMRWAGQAAERYLEPASYGAIGLLGLYLAFRGARSWWSHRGRGHRHHADEHDHHHHHHHDACGHAHLPTPQQAADAMGWRQAAAVSVAIGLRPCSGAVLVLVISYSLGLWQAGIASAFAMAAGTGLTVAFLGAVAQASRIPAAALAARLPVTPLLLASVATVVGGAVIALLGGGLLVDALNAPAHPLLGR